MDTKHQPTSTYDTGLYDTHRTLIDRVISTVARQQHLPRDVAEDFASMVWERLLESDILARFQHRCSLRTFLAVVVGNLYRDFRNQRWGKWRHSAEARRLGPLALRLELLMVRDGHTFDEAVAVLQTNHGLRVSRDELYALSLRLPRRPSRRLVGEEELENVGVPPDHIEQAAEHDALQVRVQRVREALRQALDELPPQDRLILRLIFDDGFTVAQVAGMLNIPQKPLYRRRDSLFAQTRRRLEAAGVRAADLADVWQELSVQWQGAPEKD